MRLSCSCPCFFSLCSHSTPPAGDLGWLGHQGSTLIYWASCYRIITHWYFPPESSISFYPWLYKASVQPFHIVFAVSRIMMFKRWSKRKKWMKPQLGQSRKIASAPLSLLYIGKRTTKPSGSPDASCFLISFYGPCACRGTSLALLMIYGKQIKIKAAVGLHCAMSDPGPR